MLDWESIPWCNNFDRAIDDELVNKIASKCFFAKEYNGCGNCPCQTQKEILVKKDKTEIR